MSADTISDLFEQTLAQAGVRRIYGLVGDSLNGITESVRKQGRIDWIHVRHEETAAFAAGAEAHLTDTLAVCAGSCGPGNLHLINGLFDCHRSGVLETAIRTALGRRGVAVIVIPGDVALSKAPVGARLSAALLVPSPIVRPSDSSLDELAVMLNAARRVTLFCGRGCFGAHDDLMRLADKLKSPIVHALGGKEGVEHDNPFDVGMTGLIGFSSGYHAMQSCDVLLLLGTDFPYRQFYPTEAKIAQVDLRAENLGRRCPIDLGLIGDVGATIAALLPRLDSKQDRAHLDDGLAKYAKARQELDDLAVGRPGHKPIHPQYLAKVVSDAAAADAVFTCDVGTPTIWAARYLKLNGRRRLVGSFVHGSMASALPQALGAQAAYPGRQVVSLSGDGGFAMLMGDFITLTQHKLPVKVVIFNNGTLGFVEMEMKVAGYLQTGVDLVNPDFAAMARAMGVFSRRVEDPADLEAATREVFAHDGPALLDVVTNRQELAMPPKTRLAQGLGFSLYALKAVMNGQGDEVIELARSNLFR
jgi:pyruvate dehydrogenase (quinone)